MAKNRDESQSQSSSKGSVLMTILYTGHPNSLNWVFKKKRKKNTSNRRIVFMI